VPMRRIRPLLAVACLLACVTASRLADAAATSFLWKISGRQNVVYLVGSVHMLTKDFYPVSSSIESAYKDYDLLVEEADLGDMLSPTAQFQMLTRGMLPSGQSIDKVVSPATYGMLKDRVGGLGMPIEALLRFKPWMLALTIEAMQWQKAGFDPDLGLDKHFYDRAQTEGKVVQGLETVDYQLSRFDQMSMDQQDKMLASTLRDLNTETANVGTLARAWKSGDSPTVERIVLDDLKQDPQMYQRLLVERNRNWLPAIEALFARRGHAFIVVGAAHLVGPDGLLAMLKTKGYSVEQQ
jgi:uncharacterized protein YbaP (TraB family)